MSGIVGIYYLDGRPVEQSTLGRITDLLAHRGPDAANLWCEGNVGFGHRMLWTTPESLLEQQPVVAHAGNLVLTADARIDNRTQLIDRLGLSTRAKESLTDADLILKAYERWGEDCAAELIGDFAFAIWNRQTQTLFCARDPLGVKPFYYYRNQSFVVFASEIKAILALPEVPCQLNDKMVADYLAQILYFTRKEDSFYQDILELKASHCLSVSPQRSQVRVYWTPDFTRDLKLRSNQEYEEAFRELFTEAVTCRTRSAFPVGSTLSGGLDSSSVACTARNYLQAQNRPDLHTFSAVFPTLAELSPKIDERDYMRAVVDQGGVQPHWVHADQCSPLMDYEQVFWHGEEPIPAPNFYMDWAVFKAAQQEQVRVLLTGIDGDTTVTYGVDYLYELARSGRWIKAIQEGGAWAKNRSQPRAKTIWNYGFRPLIPYRVRHWRNKLRGKVPPLPAIAQLYPLVNSEFAEHTQLADRIEVGEQDYLRGAWIPGFTRSEHWEDLTNGSVHYALQWLDRSATASGLEARHPFCDRRLVDFCIAVPNSQRLQQGWTRSILRRSMTGILPPKVQWRIGKGDLGANFRLRLLQDEQALLDWLLLDEAALIAPYVNLPLIQAQYRRYSADPNGHDAEAVSIFTVANLALWLRQQPQARPLQQPIRTLPLPVLT
jgi:asparagine synthase (glutamine-hydrolysing)